MQRKQSNLQCVCVCWTASEMNQIQAAGVDIITDDICFYFCWSDRRVQGIQMVIAM